MHWYQVCYVAPITQSIPFHSFIIVGGANVCSVYSLGYAELYFALASFATFFDYQLHDTTEENVRVARDRGVPFPEAGHLTVRAKVVGVHADPARKEDSVSGGTVNGSRCR